MFEKAKLVKRAAALLVGFMMGLAGYAIYAHCSGLSCDFEGTGSETANADPNAVSAQFVIADVSDISELAPENMADLPENAVIQLPLEPTTQEFIVAFNDLLNASNRLEVEMRDRLPRALYGVQETALSGNFSGTFDAIVQAEREIQTAEDLHTQFTIYLSVFSKSLDGIDPAVRSESDAAVVAGGVVDSAAEAFIAHAEILTKPQPPSVEDIEKLGAVAGEMSAALEAYALSVQAIYDAIKNAI